MSATRTARIVRSVTTAALATLALSLTACGGDDEPTTTTTSTTSASTVSSASAGTSSTTTLGAPPSSSPPSQEVARMASLDVTKDGNVDVLRFAFGNATPGYRVEYVDAVTTDGEGAPVSVDGAAILKVVLRMASTYSDTAKPVTAIPANSRPPNAAHVREIRRIGDFEGTLSWAIGVDSKAAVHVQSSDEPHAVTIRIG
jgi:hypothetical protein